jgi:hypothetical protein
MAGILALLDDGESCVEFSFSGTKELEETFSQVLNEAVVGMRVSLDPENNC